MHAAALRFELRLRGCRSLKAKRAVLRPIVDGLRHRYRVSVAEVDHHEQWQRAAVAVAVVAATDGRLAEILATLERFVAHAPDVELLETLRADLSEESRALWEQ